MTEEYNSNQIEILEGLEAVRKRPGMYIGSTNSKGLHHCIWEILDNSVDEGLAGYCDNIDIILNKDKSITIKDDGRGMPVDIHKKTGFTTERVIFTILHAGGKFGGGGYKVSGGLHGVGASVVNALSKWLEVEVSRDGKVYGDRYENGGKPVVELINGELPIIGESKETGTKVTFKPDDTIFETTIFNSSIIKKKLKEMSYLNKGIKFNYVNNITDEKIVFHEEEGIVGFLKDINKDKDVLTDILYIDGVSNNIEVEIALQYTTGFSEEHISYCNNISTGEGGTHVTGLKVALTNVVNKYAKELSLLKGKSKSIDGADVRNGITSVISIKHTNPQYEGQTKGKLGNTDAKFAVQDVFSTESEKFFDRNIPFIKAIIDNALKSQNVRNEEEKIKKQSNKGKIAKLNGKLAMATSKNPQECEIVVLEGDSAGGSAKQGRDRKFQAILPLRGKIMNVEKQKLDKILNSDIIRSMVTAFGTGMGKDFDISKFNYNKVIIMTDADVDGSHIRTLILTFFYRYMRELIDSGKVWVAVPPLYKIVFKNKKIKYAYSDKELESIKSKSRESIKSIQRYKGLGEMNPDQLWETTLNPETRLIKQVYIGDCIEAEKTTVLLMGDKGAKRKQFVFKYIEEDKANG